MTPPFQMDEDATKVEELLLLGGGGGRNSVSRPEMDAALRSTEQLINNLQLDMDQLSGKSPAGTPLANVEQLDNLSVVHRVGDQAAGSPLLCKRNPNGQQGEHPEHC